ncbi:MAG: hypothetical protein MI919_05240, partial [Holophagales bacterium]|nr:hypothetical protein [Holophagales bacterium]
DLRLPGRGRLSLALVLALILAMGGVRSAGLLGGLAAARGGQLEREEDWAALGRALPAEAKVAAEWGSTAVYLFYAPHALFLNVLDPVFMAVPFPEAHAAVTAIFDGREPDVPSVLARELDSEYLAFSRFQADPKMLRRLISDPRFERLYTGYSLLYRAVPERNGTFVLDWRLPPPGSRVPPATDVEPEGWRVYPRVEDPALRPLEAFVELDRAAGRSAEDQPSATGELPRPVARCASLVHAFEVAEAASRVYELAPAGPTTLWLGDELVVATASMEATLGAGVVFQLELEPGEHRITVLTCRGTPEVYRPGFYLLQRDGMWGAPVLP